MPDTRDLILTTAFKHFFSRGYKDVTMSELVEASGLSKGAFYHYFSSKEELYNLTMEKHLYSYLRNFSLHYNEALTLKDNIKGLFSRFSFISTEVKGTLTQHPSGLSNYFMFLVEALKNPEFNKIFMEANDVFHDELEKWFIRAIEKGEISKDSNPHTMSRHLAGLMKGLTVIYTFSVSHESISVTFNHIIDDWFELLNLKNSKL